MMKKMKYIENEQFLHVQREVNGLVAPLWNMGDTYFIGQKKNGFFEFFDYADANFNSNDIN